MRAMRRALPALALAAFAVAYLWQALSIPLDPWSAAEAVNARTLPTVYAVTLLLVCMALLLRTRSHDVEASSGERSAEGQASGRRWLTLAAHCAAIVAFGALVPLAGLWIAVALLLLGCLLIAGERRIWVLAAAPVGTALAAWLLVAVVLDVYIAPGRWLS